MSTRETAALPNSALPGWSAWEGIGQTTAAFLHHELDLGMLALASRIFWPALRFHRGCVLLVDGNSDEKFAHWFEHLNGDLLGVERICNHRHLVDMLPDCDPPMEGEVITQLGEVLRATWQSAVDAFVGARATYVVRGWYDAEADDYELTLRRQA